jgi:hypothetical protein
LHRNDAIPSRWSNKYDDWYFRDYPELAPTYQELFDIQSSDAAYEQFTTAVGMGDMLEKPEGEDLRADNPLEAYTIVCKNRTFGRMVRFTYEAIEDAQKGGNLLKTTVGQWAKSVARSKDRWYADLIDRGALTAGHTIFDNTIPGVVTDSSGNKIYDGQTFFASAHPDKVGGTYNNTGGTTSLSHTNLKTYYTTYTSTNAFDERGNEIENEPNVLIVKADELFNARVILANTAIPGSADNDINVLAAIVGLMQWQRLQGTSIWLLGRRKAGLMGLERQDALIDFYQDETNKDYYATIFLRWGGCITDWRPWIASNLDTT